MIDHEEKEKLVDFIFNEMAQREFTSDDALFIPTLLENKIRYGLFFRACTNTNTICFSACS